MLHFEEKHGSIYCMDDTGNILYEMTEPAILFCKISFTKYMLGNREDVDKYYNSQMEKAKGTDLLDNHVMADIPLDVEILNKLINISGYARVLFNNVDLSGF
jgi:hypothetical protein